MPHGDIKLRFYGRIVMAETGGDTPVLTFLMPNMQYPGKHLPKTFARHSPLMTVCRENVKYGEKTDQPTGIEKSTHEPSYRVLTSTDLASPSSEHLVWDLAGWTVDAGGSGDPDLSFTPALDLIDLNELEDLGPQKRKAVLDTSNLTGTLNGKVLSAVRVGQGQASAFSVSSSVPTAYVTLTDALSYKPGDPAPKPWRGFQRDVDMIEIVVPNVEFVRLDFSNAGGLKEFVNVFYNGTTVISFSNLCTCYPQDYETFDLEFGQYYNLLKFSGDIPSDVLVPQQKQLRGYEDCDNQARIKY